MVWLATFLSLIVKLKLINKHNVFINTKTLYTMAGNSNLVVRFVVDDRNYNKYSFVDDETNKPVVMKKISPISAGLFNNDDIIYIRNESIERVTSKTREKPIAGVLVLNTFHGKYKDSFIYKFVPYDKVLPMFLVPYKNKNLSSFDKSVKEIYAVIKFSKWDKKHPEGTVVTAIGDVRVQTNFYVYLLHVKIYL